MQISQLEHFPIIADDIEETASWYVENLGFRVGKNPDFGVPVTWLYLGDRDVIHISHSRGENRFKRPAATRAEIVKGGASYSSRSFQGIRIRRDTGSSGR